jgi:hypothetical protein
MRRASIKQCFLSGEDSERTLIHHIKVYNVVTNSVDDVYISDFCWREICGRNDETVANFWSAYREMIGAGYTDNSFISLLKESVGRKNGRLMVLICPRENRYYLAARSPQLSRQSSLARLLCRTSKPIPSSLANTAIGILGNPIIEKTPWRWIEGQFAVLNFSLQDTFMDEQPSPEIQDILYANNKIGWGVPPDIFQSIVFEGKVEGYALLKRLIT